MQDIGFLAENTVPIWKHRFLAKEQLAFGQCEVHTVLNDQAFPRIL